MHPYFKADNFTLLLGDSLTLLKSFPDNYFNLIFADPPYNLSNDGFSFLKGKKVSVNKGEWDKSDGFKKDYEFHLTWLSECKRVLSGNGTIWVSGTHHSIFECGYALQSLGFSVITDVIWYKPNALPNLSRRSFKASHETLIWAKKTKQATHTFNYDLIWKVNERQMDTVWTLNPPAKEEFLFGRHPTQKPLSLLKRLILASSCEGDRVLDPFTGSSTTGIAAMELRRQFVGIDSEVKYLDVSVNRFKALGNTNLPVSIK